MSFENFNYRTNPLFLRNQFSDYSDKFGIPIIPKSQFSSCELQDLRLIGFNQVKRDNGLHANRMVHFFLYDYLFETIWKDPQPFIGYLSKYTGVLTPDFSMYIEMPITMQLYNTFRNRWCGAYLKSKGIRVIPTINWGTKESFEFCFAGVPKGSTVAVSTYMFHSHGNHADQKDLFMRGYREMLRQIEPEHIICYSEPFKEMSGNITYVDYDLSSWKHMADDVVKSNSIKHMIGYVMKGGGSAYGGEWMPKDANSERFLGKPNSIERHYVSSKKGDSGYYADLKYDENGRAVYEREYTNHGKPYAHSNPHDHTIDWSNGTPDPSPPINYYDEVIPEFKKFKLGDAIMKNNNYNANDYDFSFESLSELKSCISRGAEITFDYNGHLYGIGKLTETTYYIGSCSQNGEPEPGDDLFSSDIEEILDYSIGGKKLRERLDDIEIVERTL